jgi:hypothetical protein
MDDVAHLFVSYQHLFFYPLMMVGRWNLYVQVRTRPSPRSGLSPRLSSSNTRLCASALSLSSPTTN